MSTTRVKDASFVQQNIEKILLAVGALILLVALVLFVFGNPFAVELSGRKFDNPREAVEILTFADGRIDQGLAKSDPLTDTTTPDFLQNYTDMLNMQVPTNPRIAELSRVGLLRTAMLPAPTSLPRYARPAPPVPTDIQFVVGADVLDTTVRPDIANQFFALWGEEREPADFTMFIASGDFDRWEWSERLTAPPETRGETLIPRGIWSERFFIAGVALLREEWDPINEVWTNRHIVAPLPEQFRYLDSDTVPVRFEQAGGPEQLPQAVVQIREEQDQIAQPDLPWLLGGQSAMPPGGEELGEDVEGFDPFGRALGAETLGRTERRIMELQERIRVLEEARAARQNNRPQRPNNLDGPPREGGPEAGAASDPYERNIQRLQDQIQQLQPRADIERAARERIAQERAQAEEERRRIQALYEGSGRPRPGTGTNPYSDDPALGLGVDGVQIQEGSTIRVYAADPTMQPGMTYRYKLIVSVINPLYGVPGLEPEQLAENYDNIALLPSEKAIEDMPWIGPVTVEPEAHFFFTNRSNKVEVYRRINGVQRRETFDVSPGDMIGGIAEVNDPTAPLGSDTIRVDMSVGAILVDIEQRADIRGNSYTVMIYMDAQGNISERTRDNDVNSPIRRQLEEEIANGPDFPLRPAQGAADFDPGFNGPGRFGGENF